MKGRKKYEELREGVGIHTAEKENFKRPFPFFRRTVFYSLFSLDNFSGSKILWHIFRIRFAASFFLSMIYAMSGCTLNEKEDALQNEVEEARWLLEEYEANSCNASVNALIDFYRSCTEERGRGSIKKMYLRTFSDMYEFRNAMNEIVKNSEQEKNGRKRFQRQENISDKELFISERPKKGSDRT